MTAALANGCLAIKPFATVQETLGYVKAHREQSGEVILSGGERNGKKIDGFDLGNSPLEYVNDVVRGKVVAFTTTNGTQAIDTCRQADQIFLGSFVNLTALVNRLRDFKRVALVCAGTHGEITTEDVLFAGAVAARLCEDFGFSCTSAPRHLALNIAKTFWQTARRQLDSGVGLSEILQMTLGGQNLFQLGYTRDINFAAVIDQFDFVPEFSPVNGVVSA